MGVPHDLRAGRQSGRCRGPHCRGVSRRAATAAVDGQCRRGAVLPAEHGTHRARRALARDDGAEITCIDLDIEAPPEAEESISTAPDRVAAVLDALPDNYRRILELRFLQTRSIKESAAELGVSVANAKVLQHRALRLAAQINEKGEP